MPSRNQVARGVVDDETWHAAAAYVGKIMESELRRRTASSLSPPDEGQPQSDQALAAHASVRLALDELDDIAGRLSCAAVAHGAQWDDVASSLRLSADAALPA